MTEFMDRQIRLQRAGQKEYTEEEVRLIINGAIQEEREACAKVAENGRFLHDDSLESKLGKSCAAAIRARGQG
jgi:hypothetical protein